VNSLKEKELKHLIKKVMRAEKKTIADGVLAKVIEESLGSARSALVYLEKVIDIEDEALALEALSVSETLQAQVIDLCRALLTAKRWNSITEILAGIKEEPESVRRAVLGYCNAILMKKKDANAYLIATSFADNFFSSGKTGLTLACYDVMEGRE